METGTKQLWDRGDSPHASTICVRHLTWFRRLAGRAVLVTATIYTHDIRPRNHRIATSFQPIPPSSTAWVSVSESVLQFVIISVIRVKHPSSKIENYQTNPFCDRELFYNHNDLCASRTKPARKTNSSLLGAPPPVLRSLGEGGSQRREARQSKSRWIKQGYWVSPDSVDSAIKPLESKR